MVRMIADRQDPLPLGLAQSIGRGGIAMALERPCRLNRSLNSRSACLSFSMVSEACTHSSCYFQGTDESAW